jgi:hypothetical protein
MLGGIMWIKTESTGVKSGVCVEKLTFMEDGAYRYEYYADRKKISPVTYSVLQGRRDGLYPNLRRETDCCGDTRYFADDFPVSEKIYKALGGKVPACEFTGCGGTVTFTSCSNSFPVHSAGWCIDNGFKQAPKPKTRGEEVAETLVREEPNYVSVGGWWLKSTSNATPTNISSGIKCTVSALVNSEIAAAEKRGEEKYKELRSYARSLARSAQINADSNGSFTIHRGSTSYGWAKRIIELTE